MSRVLPELDADSQNTRARVDIDAGLRDQLRKKARRAGISLNEAVQVAVRQALQLKPQQLRRLAEHEARLKRPKWWPFLCTELRKRRRREEPIETEKRRVKNKIVEVREKEGYVVLVSERNRASTRNRTGERRVTVDEIGSSGTANEAVRLALYKLAKQLEKEAQQPRQ